MLKDLIKPLIPATARSRLAMMRVHARVPMASLRRLPDLLIIGGMRCGTSSLYRYLGSHPEVSPAIRKETEYFSRYFDRGVRWYRAHYPLRVPQGLRRSHLSFEATPYYLLHPHAPARAAGLVPSAKLIVMLREPASRAYSHHQHMYRLGLEELDFEQALDREAERTDAEWEKLLQDPLRDSLALHRHSYIRRGRYAEQIRRWLEYFPMEEMLFVEFERFFRDPHQEFGKIVDFLGIDRDIPAEFKNFSYVRSSTSSNSQSESRPAETSLKEYFAPFNTELERLIGIKMSW